MRFLVLLIALLAGLAAFSLIWRGASRRWSLPYPAWLSWGFESPWVTWIYGTEKTLDRIGLRPGQRVLELGPGPGRLLIPAARRVEPKGEVVGLDIQPRMIDRLRSRAAEAGVENLTGIVGDAATTVPPGEFDVVFLALTLGEIPDREGALQRSFDALRVGGVLSITEMFPDPHFVPQRTVRCLAERARFRHIATHGFWRFFTANSVKPTATPDTRDRTRVGGAILAAQAREHHAERYGNV